MTDLTDLEYQMRVLGTWIDHLDASASAFHGIGDPETAQRIFELTMDVRELRNLLGLYASFLNGTHPLQKASHA